MNVNMSKCTFSKKFEPLIYSWKKENLTETEFETRLNEVFEESSVKDIMDAYFKKGSSGFPSILPYDAYMAQQKFRNGNFTSDGLTARANYSKRSEYDAMINEFKKRIVSDTLYDFDNERFIDSSELIDGYSRLNINLFNYKKELVNDLYSALGEAPLTVKYNDNDAGSILDKYIAIAKSKYEQRVKLSEVRNYNSYVILSYFNELLAEHAPYVTLKDPYKNSLHTGLNMYDYEGPRAKLRTSWSKEDYIPGAEESYSKLAKILLDVFPEIDKFGNVVTGSSIETSGFASVMCNMRSAILYNSDESLQQIREEYFKGAKGDMLKMIDAYLNYVEHNSSYKKEHMTYLGNKLRGIRKFIYAGNMQSDIWNMFTRMFYEGIPNIYMTYGTYNGEFKGVTLSEAYVNNQNYDIQRVLNGRIYNFKTNPKRWGVIKNRYKIKYTTGSNSTKGQFVLSPTNDKQITIDYTFKDRSIDFTVLSENSMFGFDEDSTDFDALSKMLYDITGFSLTSEYYGYAKNRYDNKFKPIQEFADLLGSVILTCNIDDVTNSPFVTNGVFNSQSNQLNFNRFNLYNNFREVAIIQSLIKGSETTEVVKDVNGNNLPSRGLSDLAHQLKEQLYEIHKTIKNGEFSYAQENLVVLNEFMLKEPVIREGVSKDGKGKKTRKLSENELYECALSYDYLSHLITDGTIYLQSSVHADKGKTYLWGFDLTSDIYISELEQTNLLKLLKDIMSDDENSSEFARNELSKIYFDVRSRRYARIAIDTLDKFNTTYGQNFNTLKELDDWLAQNPKKYETVKKDFKGKFIFADDFDVIKDDNGNIRINDTLVSLSETFNELDQTKSDLRLQRCKRMFVYDLYNAGFTLNRFSSKGGQMVYKYLSEKLDDKWVDKNSGNVILAKAEKDEKTIKIGSWNCELLLDPNVTVTINPLLESYLYADILLSNELNSVQVGETFAHKLKKNNGSKDIVNFDVTQYEEFAEAGRLVAQYKRNVIPGASMHVFLQGLDNGVSEYIEVAVFEDMSAFTFNMQGDESKVDSQDGSGVSNIYQALLEQNSLIDAKAGVNEKTIGWFVDPVTGRPMMLKWAVYATTNEKRRISRDSVASYELAHKKFNSKVIGKNIDVQQYFKRIKDNLYFKDIDTKTHYKIEDVLIFNIGTNENPDFLYYRKAVVCDKNGNLSDKIVYLDKNNKVLNVDQYGTPIMDKLEANARLRLNTIYDYDIFFGGAYAKQFYNGTLHYSDVNNKITLDIICEQKLKDKFIAYGVNKSAYKVGYANVNSVDAWSDDSELSTITMSTRHIGLQLNAEHELENSEVTEMTQMISSLAENWYTEGIINEIYKDIGAVVEESLKKINKDINLNNLGDLRIRLGKALVDAFKTKKDTLGLAQAFLSYAEDALRKYDPDVEIPFSASTINSAFISTVTSMLNKKGIRRKYSGFAGILHPSYNVIQFYRFTNPLTNKETTTLHESVADLIVDYKEQHPEFNHVSIKEFMYSPTLTVNGMSVNNPFVEDIINHFDIKQGDTIVVWNENLKDWSKPIVIDTWQKYDLYVNKQLLDSNNVPVSIKRLSLAPRNLQGANTTFTYNGQEYCIYNLDSVRASHGDQDAFNRIWKIIESGYYKEDVVEENGKINIKKTLQNVIQHQTEDLSKGVLVDSLFENSDGSVNQINVENVHVIPAEVIMGRLYMEQFNLREGDQVNDILEKGSDFFYERLFEKYSPTYNLPKGLYDVVVHTKNGPLFIKVNEDQKFIDTFKDGLSRNHNIETVDEKLIYNNIELCDAGTKKNYSYTASDGKQYDIICVDENELSDILESDAVSVYDWVVYKNNTFNNLELVWKYNFSEIDPKTFKTVDDFRSALERKFKERITKLSIRQFKAFKKSLELIGARIPTQAMQSFMPLKVIAFTESLEAEIFVPVMQTWLQGSDYEVISLY